MQPVQPLQPPSADPLTILVHVPRPARIPTVLTWLSCYTTPAQLFMFVHVGHVQLCYDNCKVLARKPRKVGQRCTCDFGVTRTITQHDNGTTSGMFWRAIGSYTIMNALTSLRLRTGSALLFAHADFYLDVPKFIGSRDSIAYATPTNLTLAKDKTSEGRKGDLLHHRGLGCIPIGSLWSASNSAWHWRSADAKLGVRRMCADAAQKMGSDVCCVSWIDAFFVPATRAKAFVDALRLMSPVMPNEAALPTALHHASRGPATTRSTRSAMAREVPCLGGCCVDVPWSKAVAFGCGHRVDLTAAPPWLEHALSRCATV